jgi:hypothetical protein
LRVPLEWTDAGGEPAPAHSPVCFTAESVLELTDLVETLRGRCAGRPADTIIASSQKEDVNERSTGVVPR